ncbi:hypothetical protein K2173_011683 [Erythroxylum novogranatense]|uniref:CN hydrolase domain-containing protein n=1 Tax=Erythroxylum novogranatense TaxID=1862640 RepID=A0AAV8T0J3_9ROSI|nr:hypothetical protein K2173_011683 [Erythroxylum novogranatense]
MPFCLNPARLTINSHQKPLFSTTVAGVPIMAAQSVKVAAAQMTSVNDLATNFATCSRLVKLEHSLVIVEHSLEAASAGAKLLCLPESFSYIGEKDGDSVKVAEPLDGPIMQQYCSLARESGIWLSLGGFQEKGSDDAHLKHPCYWKEVVAVDSPAGRLGLSVCYDLRFPELYQQLRFKHEAKILLVPSAFTKITGEAHWEILLRARAIETQCYVIAATQAGHHNDKRESFGDTLIIDPWGTIVGRLHDRISTGITVADIDFSLIESVRAKIPIDKQRKPIDFWKSASL